jgi:cellulose synthase/poly-beta-1,6-N-acetylglucosamine synthase-like glycosyltransferase
MKPLFWSSLSLIFFAYAGYPICLYLWARFWPRPVRRGSVLPSVTILIAIHNEEKYLPAKLQNLAQVDYPADRLQIVVVSDGSTDETNRILTGGESPALCAVILPEHGGKATALNHGVAAARGEVIVFTDARQTIAAQALRNLVANFADPAVGCVSGELMIGQGEAAAAQGVGLYWRMEKKIRQWEGLAGSTVGATGALYAVRKNLIPPLPSETILDDVYIPLHVVRQGQRVVFEPHALAFDPLTPNPKQEFRRKLRTLVGNYQLLHLAPWVLTRPPLRLQFICHKLLRLLVPFALMGMFVSTVWLGKDIYELVLLLQLVFYALAGLRLFPGNFGIVSRLSDVSLAFLVLNAAAALAFLYFITGRKAIWSRT